MTDHTTPASEPAQHGDTQMAQLAHLGQLSALVGIPGFVAPLIVMLIRKDDPLAGPHAREAFNFQLTWTIILFASAMSIFLIIGLLLLPVAAIAYLILFIMGVVRGMNAVSAGSPTAGYVAKINFIKG